MVGCNCQSEYLSRQTHIGIVVQHVQKLEHNGVPDPSPLHIRAYSNMVQQ